MVSLDQKSSLSPPPIKLPPTPPLLCPSSLSLILLKELISPSLSQSHPLPLPPLLLLLPPLIQPPGLAFGPLEARWPLRSWHHGVWRVGTRARDKGLMMSCQLARPRGCYVTAHNNMVDRNPLHGGTIFNRFTPLQ